MRSIRKNKNFDIYLTVAFTVLTVALFAWVSKTCTDQGCIFGMVLVLISLFDAFIFTIVVFAKGFRNKNMLKLAVAIVSLIIEIGILILVVSGVSL